MGAILLLKKRRLVWDMAGFRGQCKAAELESWEWKLFMFSKQISHYSRYSVFLFHREWVDYI